MTSKERASSCLKILDSSFPDAACTLESDTPERLAVRGILSAQCTDERVNLTCRDLFEKYPQMKDILAAGKETIEEMIRPCGLHRMKAKAVISFAGLYEGEWGRKVPDDLSELMRCPGIGRKIANLIVGEIYGIPALVVDTHCKRVMKRLGFTTSDDPLKVEKDVCKVFPEECYIRLGHMAVELGRTFCKAGKPRCADCPLNDVCRKKI